MQHTDEDIDRFVNAFEELVKEVTTLAMDNKELIGLREENVPRGVYNYFPAFADHAKNAVITDVEGREFIDLAGGIGVMNVGHCHPKVVEAVQRQAERFSHTSFNVMMYEPYVRLAEKLNQAAPGKNPEEDHVRQLGRRGRGERHQDRPLLHRARRGHRLRGRFPRAHHAGLTLTSKVLPYKTGFGPFAPRSTASPTPTVIAAR